MLVYPMFLLAGLAQVKHNSENLIFFSTAQNSHALDFGKDDIHSPFVRALMNSLSNKDLTLGQIIEGTIKETGELTNYYQIPSVVSNLTDTQFRFSNLSSIENRFALLIANEEYTDSPLSSPKKDALSLKKILEKQGFHVTVLMNSNYSKMVKTIKSFTERLPQNSISFFFYAGHGFSHQGNNYLLPLQTNISSEYEILGNAIKLEDIISRFSLSNSSKNLLFLDTSRSQYGFLRKKDISPEIQIEEKKIDIIKQSLLKEKPFIVDELIKQIFVSDIHYNFKTKVKYGKENTIEIVLGTNDVIDIQSSLKTLELEVKKQIGEKIKFAKSLDISLVSDSIFFKPITPTRQIVNPFNPTIWKWTMKPKKSGDGIVRININALLNNGGSIMPRSIYLEEKSINIEDSYWGKLIQALKDNWTFIIGSIIIPLIIWGWTILFRKDQEPITIILKRIKDKKASDQGS